MTYLETHKRAAEYFDRSGCLFDSLYSEEKMSGFMRHVNRRFRRDIYERYLLTIEHVSKQGAASVLDVGVGGAKYARGYADAGVARVVGIDISETMLQIAELHVRTLSECGTVFEFARCDIMHFRTNESFDVVVAMGFFDYIEDPLLVLSRLKSLSRGSVVASFPSRSFIRTPLRRIRYFLKRCPVFFFDRDEINRLCKEAGFKSWSITKIAGAGMDYFVEMFA